MPNNPSVKRDHASKIWRSELFSSSPDLQTLSSNHTNPKSSTPTMRYGQHPADPTPQSSSLHLPVYVSSTTFHTLHQIWSSHTRNPESRPSQRISRSTSHSSSKHPQPREISTQGLAPVPASRPRGCTPCSYVARTCWFPGRWASRTPVGSSTPSSGRRSPWGSWEDKATPPEETEIKCWLVAGCFTPRQQVRW